MTAKTSKKKAVKKSTIKKSSEKAARKIARAGASSQSQKSRNKNISKKKSAPMKKVAQKKSPPSKAVLKKNKPVQRVKAAKKTAAGVSPKKAPKKKTPTKQKTNVKKIFAKTTKIQTAKSAAKKLPAQKLPSKKTQPAKKQSSPIKVPAAKTSPTKAQAKTSAAKALSAKVATAKLAAKTVSAPKPAADKKSSAKKSSNSSGKSAPRERKRTEQASIEVPKKKKKTKPVRPSESIYFSIEDLNAFFERRENGIVQPVGEVSSGRTEKKAPVKTVEAPKSVAVKLQKSNKPIAAASIFDILGIASAPVQKVPIYEKIEERNVPRKWKKYYDILIELRKKYSEGVNERVEEVHKRSVREDSGDLSYYGQHLDDAGSASFERDMSYNLLEQNKGVLDEINEAVKRIKNGTYGICEITGVDIPEGRLLSIPYTRYTKEGQEIKEEQERRKRSNQRSVFDIPEVGSGDDSDGEAQ